MSVYFDRKSAGRLRKQRQHKGRIKAILLLIVMASLVVSAVFGFRYFQRKGAFNVREIRLSGNKMTDGSELMEIAEALKGKPFWKPGLRGLSDKICRKFPAVKCVTGYVWPWGLADIRISERKPLAKLEHDSSQMIDAEGVIFVSAGPNNEKSGLPRLRVRDADRAAVWRALRLAETAPWMESDWLIDPTDQNDIKLMLPGGVPVHFGNGSFAGEWKKLGEVLELMKDEKYTATEIDLRFCGQAVVKGQTLAQKAP